MEPNFRIQPFSNMFMYTQASPVPVNFVNHGTANINMSTNSTHYYSVEMQNEISKLKADIESKNKEIAELKEQLRASNTSLKVLKNNAITDAINNDWNLSIDAENYQEFSNKIDDYGNVFKQILKDIDVNNEFYICKLPTDNPDVLARMDALYLSKLKNTLINDAERLLSELKRPEFKNVIEYIKNFDHTHFIGSLYSRLITPVDERSRLILGLLVSNHVTRRQTNIDLNQVVDYMAKKYDNTLDSNICNIKIDYDIDVKGDDYIYHRHNLYGYALSMLHAFSHFDYSIKGGDIAKYHVGKSCKISECSIVEVVDASGKSNYFKPIKCSNEYVILPRLPNEVNYRVEALLHRNGVVPFTLVRTVDVVYSEHFISGPISQEVNGLMNRIKINKLHFFFSDDGLCIKVSGELDNMLDVDKQKKKICCTRAFRLNGRNQRSHKTISHDVD